MGRAAEVTNFIKGQDPLLYCDNSREGKLCVYRKGSRIESYDMGDGISLYAVLPQPIFIFALTHDWTMKGRPVDWGLTPIFFRLQEIDAWKRDIADELIKQEEREAEIRKKDHKNENEAFLKDFRKQFSRTFDDVNTSTMSKTENRKLGEKNGYC